MVESSIIDTYNYDLFSREEQYNLELPRFLRIDNYYSLYNRVRYTSIEASTKKPLYSSSTLYKNAV
jgi:hypothetical protein